MLLVKIQKKELQCECGLEYKCAEAQIKVKKSRHLIWATYSRNLVVNAMIVKAGVIFALRFRWQGLPFTL